RNTERKPCAIHFSGKADASASRPDGSWLSSTHTPEMNCSTMNGGFTTAGALLAVRGNRLKAMPSNEQAVTPSVNTQAKVSQRPGSVGNDKPNSATPRINRSAVSASAVVNTISTLPMKYAPLG